MAEIKRVGVLGCGLMGSGIAQISAAAGYETIVREVSDEVVQKGIGGIGRQLGKSVEKGKMAAEPVDYDVAVTRDSLVLCAPAAPGECFRLARIGATR